MSIVTEVRNLISESSCFHYSPQPFPFFSFFRKRGHRFQRNYEIRRKNQIKKRRVFAEIDIREVSDGLFNERLCRFLFHTMGLGKMIYHRFLIICYKATERTRIKICVCRYCVWVISWSKRQLLFPSFCNDFVKKIYKKLLFGDSFS